MDSTKSSTASTTKGPFQFPILPVIRTTQQAKGLRHGDYHSYRQFCSRKVRRIRSAIGFKHGRHKYSKKSIDCNTLCESERMLSLVLWYSERCWAFAMDLKQGNTEDVEPRPRLHAMRKLSKATKWSAILQAMCERYGDDRTSLEANAYNSWMMASFAAEKDEWTKALEFFSTSLTIYGRLAKASAVVSMDTDDGSKPHTVNVTEAIYFKKTEEIEQNIRFVNHNLRLSGADSASSAAALTRMVQEGRNLDDLMKEKLDRVLAESRKLQAATLTEIPFFGTSIPVRGENVKVAILSQQAAEFEVENCRQNMASGVSDNKVLEVCDRLFTAYNETLSRISEEIQGKRQKGTWRPSAISEAKLTGGEVSLRALQIYVSHCKADRTAERNLLLVATASIKFDAKGVAVVDALPSASSDSNVRAADLVRLYDNLIQNMEDLRGLLVSGGLIDSEGVGAPLPQAAGKLYATRISLYTAFRCYYLAKAITETSDKDRYIQASVLFSRCSGLARQALSQLTQCIDAKTEEVASVRTLIDSIRRGTIAAQVLGVIEDQKHNQSVENKRNSESVLSVNITEQAQLAHDTGATLLARLTDYSSGEMKVGGGNPRFISFPPDLETVACKPVLFDLALTTLTYPDLSEKTGSAKKGWFGGWGWKQG